MSEFHVETCGMGLGAVGARIQHGPFKIELSQEEAIKLASDVLALFGHQIASNLNELGFTFNLDDWANFRREVDGHADRAGLTNHETACFGAGAEWLRDRIREQKPKQDEKQAKVWLVSEGFILSDNPPCTPDESAFAASMEEFRNKPNEWINFKLISTDHSKPLENTKDGWHIGMRGMMRLAHLPFSSSANDYLPATVTRKIVEGIWEVTWDNGHVSVGHPSIFKIKELLVSS